MLTLNLEDFLIEIDNGTVKNVGPSTKSATVKLFDVDDTEARAFGDKRVKFVFEDGDGNEIQVALFPDDVQSLQDDLAALEAESPVFE